MPRYSYYCYDCESTLNVVHLMKERLTECTECGSEEIKKIPSLMAKKVIKKQKTGVLLVDEEARMKQGIKKNQEILEQHKKESRKDYDG
mgnify:CR=1 FL=1